MFEWLEVLRNLRQHDGGMLRLLLASALSYTMCTHQHEEFIRDSFDLRHKDLTMIIVTTIVSDDDNDNDDDDDDNILRGRKLMTKRGDLLFFKIIIFDFQNE